MTDEYSYPCIHLPSRDSRPLDRRLSLWKSRDEASDDEFLNYQSVDLTEHIRENQTTFSEPQRGYVFFSSKNYSPESYSELSFVFMALQEIARGKSSAKARSIAADDVSAKIETRARTGWSRTVINLNGHFFYPFASVFSIDSMLGEFRFFQPSLARCSLLVIKD